MLSDVRSCAPIEVVLVVMLIDIRGKVLELCSCSGDLAPPTNRWGHGRGCWSGGLGLGASDLCVCCGASEHSSRRDRRGWSGLEGQDFLQRQVQAILCPLREGFSIFLQGPVYVAAAMAFLAAHIGTPMPAVHLLVTWLAAAKALVWGSMRARHVRQTERKRDQGRAAVGEAGPLTYGT